MASEKRNSAKRKISDENRGFQDNWTEDFFFIKNNDKALCLFCKEAISVFKKFNLKRHYETHGELQQVQGDARKDKIQILKTQWDVALSTATFHLSQLLL